MCKSCDRPHPTQAECFKLFYRHDGVLYRQALPRTAFGTQSSFALYNKGANKPAKIYGKYTQILGYGRLTIGAINIIMDGGKVEDWYHREREKRNQHGIFVTRKKPRAEREIIEDDSDKQIPPKYPKYATIPDKIYKHGFLTLRMRTR